MINHLTVLGIKSQYTVCDYNKMLIHIRLFLL